MLIIDAHSDTLTKWADGIFDTHFNKDDIKDEYLGILAAFPGEEKDGERVLKQITCFNKIKDFHKVYKKDDLNHENPKKFMLALEDSGIIDSLSKIEALYNMGVRMITLSWNYNSHITSGCMEKNDGGLTSFGKSALRKMEELGITVDLSHIGEKSFYDVMDVVTKSVVLSHSNYKGICASRRNITKEQFLKVIENGGAVGINFYPPFLSDKRACLFDVIRHIDAFLSLGGEDNLGIGTDFDGVEHLPEDVKGTGDIYTLLNELIRLYGEKIAEKIAGENFLRILWQNLE